MSGKGFRIEKQMIMFGDEEVAEVSKGAEDEAANLCAAANAQMSKFGTVTEFTPPNLANATDGFVADMLGQAKRRMKAVKKMEGFFKEVVKARTDAGGASVKGEFYEARKTARVRTGVSAPMVREKYPEVAEECATETAYEQIDTKLVSEDTWPVDDWADMGE